MKNLEQELKLSLTEREYNLLKNQADVDAIKQTNFYFSSPLKQNDVMIRIRQKQNVYIACFKQCLSYVNDVAVCDERETEVTESFARLAVARGITSTELKSLFNINFVDVNYIGQMDTYRTKFVLNSLTIELDKNDYLGTTDYELECESAFVDALQNLKDYLFYTYGIVPKTSKPKVRRFMDRLSSAHLN